MELLTLEILVGRTRLVASCATALLVAATWMIPGADAQSLPSGWSVADIGGPPSPGSATFASPAFTVTSRGFDVNGVADQFTFAYRQISGDIDDHRASEDIAQRRSVGPGRLDDSARLERGLQACLRIRHSGEWRGRAHPPNKGRWHQPNVERCSHRSSLAETGAPFTDPDGVSFKRRRIVDGGSDAHAANVVRPAGRARGGQPFNIA